MTRLVVDQTYGMAVNGVSKFTVRSLGPPSLPPSWLPAIIVGGIFLATLYLLTRKG